MEVKCDLTYVGTLYVPAILLDDSIVFQIFQHPPGKPKDETVLYQQEIIQDTTSLEVTLEDLDTKLPLALRFISLTHPNLQADGLRWDLKKTMKHRWVEEQTVKTTYTFVVK